MAEKISREKEDQTSILAIDQAARCGWAYGSGCVEVWGGVVFTGAMGAKLSAFRHWLGGMIERFDPDFLAYEGAIHRGGRSTQHAYGYIGVMHMVAHEHTLGILEGPRATSVKLWLTGDQRAPKEKMVDAVMDAGCMVHDDNDADAVALLMYLQAKGDIVG